MAKRLDFWCLWFAVCLSLLPGCGEQANEGVSQTGALFPIVKNGKYGYMDKKGEVVISPRFVAPSVFSQGLACVVTKAEVRAGKLHMEFAYIKQKGEPAFDKTFSRACDFSEDRAAVKIGDKWGFIDRTGELVIKPRFDTAVAFSEGLSRVQKNPNGKWGYVDKAGKLTIGFQYDIAADFREGLAAVEVRGSWGFINKSGKLVIPARFREVRAFSEGLAYANIDGKRAYIDKTGKTVIEAPFVVEGGSFHEGLAAFWQGTRRGYEMGYINREGNVAISARFDAAGGFSEGLAAAKVGGKWGYIDKKGRFVIQPEFNEAEPFTNGLAQVKVGDKYGYVDKRGDWVWKPTK